jgi:hypothetical protein
MWTEWDSNLGSLLPYELVLLALLGIWFRIHILMIIHLLFLVVLALLVLVFNLDGSFGDCLVAKWRIYDCLVVSSRRSWFEPYWIGTIWAFVAMTLWLIPEPGRAR